MPIIHYYPPWFTRELNDVLLQKKKDHVEYKTNSKVAHYNKFSLLQVRFKFMTKKYLTEYNERIETSLVKNPCDFWKYVKENHVCKEMPKEITYKETVSSNRQEVTNMFTSMFSSVYSTENIYIDNSSNLLF